MNDRKKSDQRIKGKSQIDDQDEDYDVGAHSEMSNDDNVAHSLEDWFAWADERGYKFTKMAVVKGGSILIERAFIVGSRDRRTYVDYFDGRAERWSSSGFKYSDTMVTKKLKLTETNAVFLKKLDLLVMVDEDTISILPGRSSFRYEHVVCDRGVTGKLGRYHNTRCIVLL